MNRLNVVSASADRDLDVIRRTISTFHAVSSVDDLITALRGQSKRRARVGLLDVIGHSNSHGFLVLGTWEIDDSAQTAASFDLLLRPSLEQLGIRTIRLLGCSTGITARGQRAIARIARATRCEVLGTKRYVSKRDYGAAGFASIDALVGRNREVA